MSVFASTWDWIKSKWPWGRQQVTVIEPEVPDEIELIEIPPTPPVDVHVTVEVVQPEQPEERFGDIGNAQARMSALNVGCPWRGLLVVADGSISQNARQAAALMYAGILADPPSDSGSRYGNRTQLFLRPMLRPA